MLPLNDGLKKPPAENTAILRGRRKGIFRITAFIADCSNSARALRPAARAAGAGPQVRASAIFAPPEYTRAAAAPMAAAFARSALAMPTGRQDFCKHEPPCVLCDMKCRGDKLQAKTSGCGRPRIP